MNIVDWIAAFVKQTNLLVEQWTTASVEEGFSEGHGAKRQRVQAGLSEQQRFSLQ